MQAVLAPLRAELGLPELQDVPSTPPPGLVEAQLAVVADERVPVFSFTFGTLSLEAVREAGSVILGTATTVAEAVELERLGVDAVVAQSGEAGGHRGTFLGPFEDAVVGGVALVPRIVDRVSVPVLLAGGIMDGRGIAAALALGAEGVQLGTAFLGCPEAGSTALQRGMLAGAADRTLVTRAYSGRQARLVRTRLVDAIEDAGVDPLPFPTPGDARRRAASCRARGGSPGPALRARRTGLRPRSASCRRRSSSRRSSARRRMRSVVSPADRVVRPDEPARNRTATTTSSTRSPRGIPIVARERCSACRASSGRGQFVFGLGRTGMVFKLTDPVTHARALAVPGAHLFDPSGRGQPFRQWVVVPPEQVGRVGAACRRGGRARPLGPAEVVQVAGVGLKSDTWSSCTPAAMRAA